jgi:hypothetical protein
MKPTAFLQSSFLNALHDRGVTIAYYAFLHDEMITDDLTGEPIDENLAFADSIDLLALVKHNPGEYAKREFGLEEPIDITLEVSSQDTLDKGIVFKVGDKIIFAETEYEIMAAKRDKQVNEDHISYKLACKYHAGRSGGS